MKSIEAKIPLFYDLLGLASGLGKQEALAYLNATWKAYEKRNSPDQITYDDGNVTLRGELVDPKRNKASVAQFWEKNGKHIADVAKISAVLLLLLDFHSYFIY